MLDTIFLRIAKSAILRHFDNHITIDKQSLLTHYPFLNKNGASFVTLKHKHQLKGCIGSVVAHRKLLDDIIENAESAAFSDLRFTPLQSDECSDLTLEVSVLSEAQIIEYSDYDDLLQKLRPKIDGLILKHKSYHGTFLPQVWEQLTKPKDFLDHLSLKAGADPSIYAQHPTIYRYEVKAVEDDFQKIQPL